MVRFQATLSGGRPYESPRDSRVAELNDAPFVEASDLLSAVIGELSPEGSTVSGGSLARALLPMVRGELFADVEGSEIAKLTAHGIKWSKRPLIGEVIAIPLAGGRYKVGVIVARNRFGVAIGLLRGEFTYPRAAIRDAGAVGRPIYTDDELIADGMWLTLGRNDSLLKLFPDSPEIYHWPEPLIPGVDLGEFGAAESPDGGLRLLGKHEASAVGLLDGRYQQAYMSDHLQNLLSQGKVD